MSSSYRTPYEFVKLYSEKHNMPYNEVRDTMIYRIFVLYCNERDKHGYTKSK